MGVKQELEDMRLWASEIYQALYEIVSPKYEKVYIVETFGGKHTYSSYESARITARMYAYAGELKRTYSTRRKKT